VTRLTDFRGNVRLDELPDQLPGELNDESAIVGLCANCQHARRIVSDRGSRFYFCQLSKTDPHFPKYPRLPVLRCNGYERADNSAIDLRG
jgi:hypothetical protein